MNIGRGEHQVLICEDIPDLVPVKRDTAMLEHTLQRKNNPVILALVSMSQRVNVREDVIFPH